MIPDLQQTFRWFGPHDPVTLQAIAQTGAKGIVSALHHIPCGEVWPKAEIAKRLREINNAGFNWAVVESVNVHEAIKTGQPDRDVYIDNYITTLRNLAELGIDTVCYNFMPVLDWTRTELNYRLGNGAEALRFDWVALAAFDMYLLEREGAQADYDQETCTAAKGYIDRLSDLEKNKLADTILAGLPGTDEVLSISEFATHLKTYESIGPQELQANLAYFLQRVIPQAEAAGVRMCIHPDDPPFPILGLPRIVSTESDLRFVVNACISPANGITLCTGSLGANSQNDIPGIIHRLGKHIHFLHLRNVQREPLRSFFEADHLGGSVDMVAVMRSLIDEQLMRANAGRGDIAIPMRPDHGHKILDDFNYDTYPGYSVAGRMKGLAELRGLELGIKTLVIPDAYPKK